MYLFYQTDGYAYHSNFLLFGCSFSAHLVHHIFFTKLFARNSIALSAASYRKPARPVLTIRWYPCGIRHLAQARLWYWRWSRRRWRIPLRRITQYNGRRNISVKAHYIRLYSTLNRRRWMALKHWLGVSPRWPWRVQVDRMLLSLKF